MNGRDALKCGAAALLIFSAGSPASAQERLEKRLERIATKIDALRASPKIKMTTDIPPSLVTPDTSKPELEPSNSQMASRTKPPFQRSMITSIFNAAFKPT
jgi:hypothetical protein